MLRINMIGNLISVYHCKSCITAVKLYWFWKNCILTTRNKVSATDCDKQIKSTRNKQLFFYRTIIIY